MCGPPQTERPRSILAHRWLLLLVIAAVGGCRAQERPARSTPPHAYVLSFHGVRCAPCTPITVTVTNVSFVMPTRYTWEGYRDPAPTTTAGAPVRLVVWLAGRDPGADIIGFTASNERGLLMNTLAVCADGGPQEVELIPGFTVHRCEVP